MRPTDWTDQDRARQTHELGATGREEYNGIDGVKLGELDLYIDIGAVSSIPNECIHIFFAKYCSHVYDSTLAKRAIARIEPMQHCTGVMNSHQICEGRTVAPVDHVLQTMPLMTRGRFAFESHHRPCVFYRSDCSTVAVTAPDSHPAHSWVRIQ